MYNYFNSRIIIINTTGTVIWEGKLVVLSKTINNAFKSTMVSTGRLLEDEEDSSKLNDSNLLTEFTEHSIGVHNKHNHQDPKRTDALADLILIWKHFHNAYTVIPSNWRFR